MPSAHCQNEHEIVCRTQEVLSSFIYYFSINFSNSTIIKPNIRWKSKKSCNTTTVHGSCNTTTVHSNLWSLRVREWAHLKVNTALAFGHVGWSWQVLLALRKPSSKRPSEIRIQARLLWIKWSDLSVIRINSK